MARATGITLLANNLGPEHRAQGNNPANPSFCILPILHSRQNVWEEMDSSMHVSNDGHLYHCADPTNAYPVFHVIFVLDWYFPA